LRDLGYVEGQNVVMENRWAEGQYERFPALAAELVRLQVDVIVAVSAPAVLAAKHATQTIPIVMVGVGDAVRQGLVASLARPGGNVTGLTNLTGPELWGKRLELLREAVPSISRVGLLNDASNPFGGNRALRLNVLETVSQAQGWTFQDLKVRERDELDSVLAAMSKEPDSALIVTAEALLLSHRSSITELVAHHRLPAMYENRDWVDAGGLMSYGVSYLDLFRCAATNVDKILKGTKPADLPVEQPMKFELVLNLKTAQALGITFPPALLMLADEVIQ
jgi:putative ABC transport system substrate-binding protein